MNDFISFSEPAEKLSRTSKPGAEANTFLMVYNASETIEGAYEVMVGE
jgi:hypothetical protein